MSSGRIEIITGPMFSGKSTELLRRLTVASESGLRVIYVNHSLDNRSTEGSFSTHNPLYRRSLAEDGKIVTCQTDRLGRIQTRLRSFDVVGVDEAQFFSDLDSILNLADHHLCRVIVAGLNGTAERKKFGCIPDLLVHADDLLLLKSVCVNCTRNGRKMVPAPFTWRSAGAPNGTIDIGGSDKYISVCRTCFNSLSI